MKILVVDDEHSLGSLLGRALGKLGHTARVFSHPEDALAAFGAESFDAVITDIDMPGMHGVELARRFRAAVADLPIAFCTGSSSEDELVKQAETIGSVMPKLCSVADVRGLVAELGEFRHELARGSQHRLEHLAPKPPGVPQKLVQDENPPQRRSRRKIKLTCRDWAQVAKLCDERPTRRRQLTVRGSHRLQEGEKLLVALRLPDELVLSIVAEVGSVRLDPVDGEQVFAIHLIGLTPQLCTRLRAMAQPEQDPRGEQYHRRLARGSSVNEGSDKSQTGDGASSSNPRLRRQIDGLGKKLRS